MTRTRARLLGAATAVSVLGAGLVAVASPALALPSGCTQVTEHKVTCTWNTEGSSTFTVPDGITTLQTEVEGAPGGAGANGVVGGAGAIVTGRIASVPGTELSVNVGGSGQACCGSKSAKGGVNGGGDASASGVFYSNSGGGGGGSDIRTGAALDTRVVVAGGGGGAGFSTAGGNAGLADGSGGDGIASSQSEPGKGATTSEGGAASTQSDGTPATSGSRGQGGRGAYDRGINEGGGGGGGLFGGGGGGLFTGGGAGSSLVPDGGTVGTSMTNTPHVTISYDPDPPVVTPPVVVPPAPAPSPIIAGPLALTTAGVPHLRGHMMSIDITGFTPGETYQVKISGVVVGHGTADAKGEIHRKVRVPLRAHRPRAKLVVRGSAHRVHKLIRIRDGIAKP